MIKHEKKARIHAGWLFWWLQQKRCNELLHLWGMILPLCHRSFQFSPALAGAFASAAAMFLFSVFGRPVMLLHIRHFNSRSLREERATWYLYKMNVATFQFSLPREERFALHRRTLPLSDFNSRSLLGERCCIPKVVHGLLAISILAPCVGSDLCWVS